MNPDWDVFYRNHPAGLVAELNRAFRRGSIAFTPQQLAAAASTPEKTFTEQQAASLLEGATGWLAKEPVPGDPDPDFPNETPPPKGMIYLWVDRERRTTKWLLLVHGMNTTGRWQQYLSFDLALWCGVSVPTFVHKYGRIVLGVLLPWRRRRFKRNLLEEILKLGQEAPAFYVHGAPDVVAHSFGTWLVGHLLLEELRQKQRLAAGKRARPTGLKLGRVILTGSILRPDFDWPALQAAGLVEDVLNVYGTKDRVVPLAHWTIHDSGPSGKLGFDVPRAKEVTTEVANVKAPFAHSQALSDEERYAGYRDTWSPFLTNPVGQASSGLAVTDPPRAWRQAWWPLRGTLLPLIGLPLVLAGVIRLGLLLGSPLSSLNDELGGRVGAAATHLVVASAVLAAVFVAYVPWALVRRLRS